MSADLALSELVSLVEELDKEETPFELPVVVLVGGREMSGRLVSRRAWVNEPASRNIEKSEALEAGVDGQPKADQRAKFDKWREEQVTQPRPKESGAFLHLRETVGGESRTWRLALADVAGWFRGAERSGDGS